MPTSWSRPWAIRLPHPSFSLYSLWSRSPAHKSRIDPPRKLGSRNNSIWRHPPFANMIEMKDVLGRFFWQGWSKYSQKKTGLLQIWLNGGIPKALSINLWGGVVWTRKIMHKLRFLKENPSHYEISEPLHIAEKRPGLWIINQQIKQEPRSCSFDSPFLKEKTWTKVSWKWETILVGALFPQISGWT